MTTSPIARDATIKLLPACGLSGCTERTERTAKDERGHVIHYCTTGHLHEIKAVRQSIYNPTHKG